MIFNDLGITYLKTGDNNKSLEMFKNAYNFFLKFKDSVNIASELINMSISAKNLKEFEIALNYQIEVLNHYKKYLDTLGLASSYNNMANLNKVVGNSKQALQYYNKALTIYKNKQMAYFIAKVDNNIGIVYKLDKKFKKALDYFEESLKLKRELNDRFGVSITLNNIAEVYELQKHYNDALILYKQSLKLKKAIGNKEGIINSLVNLGRVYFKAKDYKNAKKNFLQAVKLGGKSYLSLSDAYLYLSKISKEEGKILKSLDYLEDYAEIQDSVVNPARTKRINNIINNFELSKKDSTIQELIKFEKSTQIRISRSNSYLYALALILILIAGMGYIIFSRLRIVSKMQNDAERKNEVLEKNNLELERLNKELQDTKEKLNSEINERMIAEVEIENNKEKLKELYKKETEINDIKTRLISNITSEYKNPLTSIALKTEILIKAFNTKNKEDFNGGIEQIRIGTDKMMKLLEDALILNRKDAGPNKVNYERLDLIAFCNNIVSSTSKLHSDDHIISVVSNLDNEFIVNFDKKLLDNILANLIDNAYKYSPTKSKITVEILDNGNDFTINIKDEGIGIPEEDKEWLFEAFHRCRNVGSIRGNGLGLSVVKTNVELLLGKVSFESDENKGSVFSFTLPKVIM